MVVLTTGTYSVPAGGVALAVLMLPIVVLTAEDAMRMVPKIMKDAATHGLHAHPGDPKDSHPDRHSAILTGVMLAVGALRAKRHPAVHRAVFQLLAGRQRPHRVDEPDSVARRTDLQLLGNALR